MAIGVAAMITSSSIGDAPSGGLMALATMLIPVGLPAEGIMIPQLVAFIDMGIRQQNVYGKAAAVKLVRNLSGTA